MHMCSPILLPASFTSTTSDVAVYVVQDRVKLHDSPPFAGLTNRVMGQHVWSCSVCFSYKTIVVCSDEKAEHT